MNSTSSDRPHLPLGRLLGLDHGRRRIGVAVSDEGQSIAFPLKSVTSTRTLAGVVEQLRSILRDYDIRALVVGLPLNMDNSEGPQATAARRFGDALAKTLNLPVVYHDERLTSAAAEEALLSADLSREKRRARRDAVAAQMILQSFLQDQPDKSNEPS